MPISLRPPASCNTVVARGADIGPIGENFGAACEQIDRADLMLADLYQRKKLGHTQPEPSWPETDGPGIVAFAGLDPKSQRVSFVLDPATANSVMFAIAAQANEREAHIREVERYGQTLPEGSYGRRNRYAIAAREARINARLRAVERAYRMAIEPTATIDAAESTGQRRSPSVPPTGRSSSNSARSCHLPSHAGGHQSGVTI